MNPVRLAWWIWAAVVALILTAGAVYAEPTHKASGDGVEIVVYSEACTLKEVANLPKRATWTEKGKTFEGCVGVDRGLAIFYFSDRTVVVVPTQNFVRVVGA